MKQAKVVQDRRRFSRILFDATVKIKVDAEEWDAELIDVSLNGALATKPVSWNAESGAHCVLKIFLNKETTIVMEATLAHVDEDSLGFACDEIDIESISYLRRVIELNLGDPELMYRELHALGHMDDN
jgi:hypothetical protein